MDKEALKQALDEMRKEMRSRVGKKLLSIEVHSHTDPTADGATQPGEDEEEDPKAAEKMGISLVG